MNTFSPKKNIWAAITTVILIFGLPIGSYFYLRQGINYRKTAFAELEEQGDIKWNNYDARHALGERDSLHGNIVTLVSAINEEDLKFKSEFVKKLHAQFGNREEIKYLIVTPADLAGAKYIFEPDLLDDLFISNYMDTNILSENALLIDGNQKIRGSYEIANKKNNQKLVRHTAVLLPMEKRKTLKLIRRKEK